MIGTLEADMSDVETRVISTVRHHPAVRSIQLAGSRAERRANQWSDWDFCVMTDDFDALANDLPTLLAPLAPLSQQWDRLATRRCWMLMLPGPVKVDLIFPDVAHEAQPPWVAASDNLEAIDRHFWDWTLWLTSKRAAGKADLAAGELRKLFHHLLAPLGVKRSPPSVEDAINDYRAARTVAEDRFGVRVSRAVESEVLAALEAREP